MQADLSIRCVHSSVCWLCHAVAQFSVSMFQEILPGVYLGPYAAAMKSKVSENLLRLRHGRLSP